MSATRREFLKIAGIAAAAGAAATPAFASFIPGNILWPRGESKRDEAYTAKRWAMVIDLAKLDQKVVETVREACHAAHNVPDFLKVAGMGAGEAKRSEIKWIWPAKYESAFPNDMNEHMSANVTQRPVLVMCNHCDNPSCVRVCPTKATFQRADGLVLMDYHRCIGCRFCMAACPYGSRSFNWYDPRDAKDPKTLVGGRAVDPGFPTRTKGVVEKCNFCAERLARGEAPACVAACKNNEMVFGDLSDPESPARRLLRERYSVRRKPEMGTGPQVYYVI
jgi:molybdopterin-containing oxidoreductase family iron-sulfur binding subunit